MKVDRVGSAWLGALCLGTLCLGTLCLGTLCLGAALTAGCAVAGGKGGQAEAVQAGQSVSDWAAPGWPECGAENQAMQPYRSRLSDFVFAENEGKEVEPDLELWAEGEPHYRKFIACLKPFILAKAPIPKEKQWTFIGAYDGLARTLWALGRVREGDAVYEEMLELDARGLLPQAKLGDSTRTLPMKQAWEQGDLTRSRIWAERIIAWALAAGITAEEIQERYGIWFAKRGGSATAKADEELNAHLSAAAHAADVLAKIDDLYLIRVCGKVTLAKGKGEITATIFSGFDEYSVVVQPDGTYCLPVRAHMRRGLRAIILTASQHRPKKHLIALETSAQSPVTTVPDSALEPMKKKEGGLIVGVASLTQGGKSYGIIGSPSTAEVIAKGRKKTYRANVDEDGFFVLDVPEGRYRISSSIPFRPLKPPVVMVTSGETTVYNIGIEWALLD